METGDWGRPERIWGLNIPADPGRAIQIYEAIKDLEIKSIVDVACGVGLVAEGLHWVMPKECEIEHFDIEEYQEWSCLRLKPSVGNLFDFITVDKKYDLVMFLNSYRNWDEEPREKFNSWLKRNAKYFITSGEYGPTEDYKVIGDDYHNSHASHKLKLYTLC